MPWFWATWAGVGLVAEAIGVRSSGTLSTTIRRTIRHPVAHRITLGGWVAFVAWFTPHIWARKHYTT